MIGRLTAGLKRVMLLVGKLIASALVLVYLLIARSFLYVLTLYVSVYFVTGSSVFKHTLQDFIATEIPGFVTAATVQWGPMPSSITVCDATIHGEHSQRLVHVELLEAEIDWVAMAPALTSFVLVPGTPIPVLFRHARVVNPTMHLTMSEEGVLDLPRAFHIDTGGPSNPIARRVRVRNGVLEGGRMRVDLPEVRMDIEGVSLSLDNFLLKHIDDVTFLAPWGRIDVVDIHMRPFFRPFPSLDRLTVPMRDVKVSRFQFVLNHFETRRMTADVDGGSLNMNVAMDFVRGQTPLWKGEGQLTLPETSTLIPELFDGFASGAISADLLGHGSLKELNMFVNATSPRMVIGGHVVEDVTMKTSTQPRITPEGRINHPLDIQRMTGRVFGGQLDVGPFRYVMRWADDAPPTADGIPMPGHGTRHAFGGMVQMDGVDPWALLGTLDLTFGLDVAPFLRGSATGGFLTDGFFDEETGRLAVNARSSGIDMDWLRVAGWPLGDVVNVAGSFEVSRGPIGAEAPVGDAFEDHYTVSMSELRVKSAGDELVMDADVDIKRESIDAYADVRIRELRRFLRYFDVDDVAGRAHFGRVRVRGSIWDPFVEAQGTVVGAEFAGNPMGTMTGAMTIRDGQLTVTGLRTEAPWGTASANGRIRIWRDQITDPDPNLPFTITSARVDNLQLRNLLPKIGMSARVSALADRITGEAARLVDTIEGAGTVRATDVKLGPDSARLVTADLVANARMLKADAVAITLDSGDLVTGSVTLTKGGRRFSAQVKSDALPLKSIKWFATQGIDLTGNVTADLSIDGSLSQPVIIGTLSATDFALDPIQLGDATISLTTGRDGRVDISALKDFPGMTLLDNSYFTLKGGLPDYANLRVQATDARVYDVLPFMRIPETELVGSGLVDVQMWPGREGDSWEVVLDAMPGDVTLTLFDGEMLYENFSEVFLVQRPSGLEIRPVAMGRNLDDVVTVCGRFDPTNLWDLQIGGRAAIKLMRIWKEMFSVMDGHVVVTDDPPTAAALGDHACLPDGGNKVMRLQGELLSPALNGKMVSKNVLLAPRNLGREIEILDGSEVLIRPGPTPGSQKLVVGGARTSRVRGKIEDGQFEFWGEMGLKSLKPDSANMRMAGTEIFYAFPGEYNITFNPDVTMTASDFMDDDRRKLHMSGKTHIVEGTYYKSFDSLGQAFGNIGGSASKAHELPLVERVPWLKDLTLDLNVFGSAMEVTSPYTGGSAAVDTRFDLRVGGTMENKTVHDRLEIIPGGIVTYELIDREFEVVQGTVDFHGDLFAPELDLELSTDVLYEVDTGVEDQVEERFVTVSVRISGVPPNLDIEFWSKDAVGLDQADLQSLILTGRPRDESSTLQDSLGISFDFGEFLSSVLKAPLFEAFKARVGPQGTVTTQIVTEFGRAVQLHTKVTQAATETRVRAGFQFQLSDNLSLEGTLQRTDRAQNPTQTYEARFKYRIPLD